MIFRLLGPRAVAGILLSLALTVLLLVQRAETRHWRKQSGQFEQLYRAEQAALAATVANYRAAAAAARAADLENARRVEAEQRAINERTAHDFENRLAAARASAQRLRGEDRGAATDSRAGREAPLPGLPASSRGPSETAGESRLHHSDRLIATEQAIQLDELIRWIEAQHRVRPD